ncbi:phage major capsid protein [uncultured Agitococcus sp.]|uniref:phage major capsid protein n=1 Tax=uncultured Agitococcus sp. TaxID=1506599 RepID=UPI00261264E8|nr:phage major capsid protein [uncultured Agitococcus sp.]
MKTIAELRALIKAKHTEAKALVENTPSNEWTEEKQAAYDEMVAAIESAKTEIDRLQQLATLIGEEAATEEADAAAHNARNKHPAVAKSRALFAKWLKGGDKALTAQDWADIRATMSTTTGSEGGYTVQTDIAKTVADALKEYGGIRNVATVIQTEMGNPMSFPTSNGTSEVGELIPENTSATGQDPAFGTLSLNVFKFSSKVIAVPIELLQDSSVDIEAFVLKRITDRLGRITNQMFTTGTGTAQPRGIVTAATSGVVGATGQTTSIAYDDLIDLVHSVDPAYRMSSQCGFMLHDTTMREIRKLKDDAGRPVFLPGYDGLADAMPDTILGYPVTINQDMPVMAADAKSVLFGDFSRYYVRDVLQNTLHRFEDSAYAKLGQVGFLAWARSGGNLIDVGGAIKYYQNSAT